MEKAAKEAFGNDHRIVRGVLGDQVTVLADRAAERFLIEQLQPVLPASIWHRMIRYSIRSEMIRGSKNSSLSKRESNPAPIFSS